MTIPNKVNRKTDEGISKCLLKLHQTKSPSLITMSEDLGVPVSTLRNQINKAMFLERKAERDPEMIKAEKILYGN